MIPQRKFFEEWWTKEGRLHAVQLWNYSPLDNDLDFDKLYHHSYYVWLNGVLTGVAMGKKVIEEAA